MKDPLGFEKPLMELDEKIAHLQKTIGSDTKESDRKNKMEEIAKLEKKRALTQQEIFAKLTPWQITQIARYPDRPTTSNYIESIFEDFTELHGDRLYGDDKSIIGGLARLNGISVVVIGHQKGKTIKDKIVRNFGMPHPEGYRKALRLMQMAERFNKPIMTFIDTPGAYPGVGAEERGQSEAIARNLAVMSQLKSPILSIIIGEGGSGGALALSVSDKILMLQYAIYSVISPEGCAAILWNDERKAEEAASALKMTAPELLRLGIIDEIVPEPVGGAHRNPSKMTETVKEIIGKQMSELLAIPMEERLQQRYNRFRKIGAYSEG
ncbi:MAG: acetyl-CoA carboxylase carboxyltransferase subunit alpha [Nitrospirae bacterium]|nr:acetyl-CoA carboxylase carboxyltransferase subunit alpha [Candidatus Troglogloeales bacterium]